METTITFLIKTLRCGGMIGWSIWGIIFTTTNNNFCVLAKFLRKLWWYAIIVVHLYRKGIIYSNRYQEQHFIEKKTHRVNRCIKPAVQRLQLSFCVSINYLFHFKQKPLIKTSKNSIPFFCIYLWHKLNSI